MGYEAKMDARNEYNAEQRSEARHEFEGELPGIIEGAIDAGEYDVVCFKRVIAVMRSAGLNIADLVVQLIMLENVK